MNTRSVEQVVKFHWIALSIARSLALSIGCILIPRYVVPCLTHGYGIGGEGGGVGRRRRVFGGANCQERGRSEPFVLTSWLIEAFDYREKQ